MKSNLISPFLVVLLVMSALAVLPSGIGPVAGMTIYVDDDNVSGVEDGSMANPYNTIQEGVDAAVSGDTVVVFSGTYMENVWIDKTLVLEGEDAAITIIDTGTTPPLSDHPAVTVVADDVEISGFSAMNGASGIEVGLSSGVSISDSTLYTTKGVVLYNTTTSTVTGNMFLNASFAINLQNSHDNTISSNIFVDSSFCIDLYLSANNTILDNHITGGGFCISLTYSNNTVIANNTIMDGQFGIETYKSVGNLISRNTVLNNTRGMRLTYSGQATISHNNVSYNNHGIYLSDSHYSTIANNTIYANPGRGLEISDNQNTTITGNKISFNVDGMYLDFDSNTNTVHFNRIFSNSNLGMYLSSSSFNTIANNTIFDNGAEGMYIRSGFSYNLITNNHIHSNPDYGIYTDYGSSDNLIHHNHFESNNGATAVFNSSHKQAYAGGTNTWNDIYPSGGNYWSDWLSPDAMSGPLQDVVGADGFVDLPYYMTNLGQDNYPLTRSPLGSAGPPEATIDLDPDTLNLKSKGKWITCYIELLYGYDPRDINASTILLNDTISPEQNPKYGFVKSESSYIMDHDNDTIEERMVKFDRSAVQAMIGQPYDSIALNVTGELEDGTTFSGYDVIRVIDPPKKKP